MKKLRLVILSAIAPFVLSLKFFPPPTILCNEIETIVKQGDGIFKAFWLKRCAIYG